MDDARLIPSATERRRPRSVTSLWINTVGLVAALAAFVVLTIFGLSDLWVAFGSMSVLALTIASLELSFLKIHRRASAGLQFEALPPHDFKRIGIKLLGFYVTVGLITLIYWITSRYHGRFYESFWQALDALWPYALVVQLLYFTYVDRRMIAAEDDYWQLGCFVLGRYEVVDAGVMKQHFLGWTVKGFFLPLMFVNLVDLIAKLPAPGSSFIAYYDFMFSAAFILDLLFTCVGYVMTLRLFDAHIRSTEPTALGWLVTLICYYPIWGYVYANYLPYQDNYAWGMWLSNYPAVTIAWGSLIIVLNGIYVWTTLCFGLRFSNLTHRGILTNGPFRFTKHPAYVAKNISWWLIAVPFLPAHGWNEAARQCLMLLIVNMIYFLRARTEERHLSRDPDYVRYACWMNAHGMFRGLTRWLPFLAYRPPGAGQVTSQDALATVRRGRKTL